ncbi:uncharacterized protein LOC108096139 isoform X2 [Drosophila ficusphila]|uniref:uncharacterized protein LOC108096139 isoform X2 n=1 Tax=Drosophila ficusphila TaxID=30025 RepID=UPI0007E6DA06|nr:uncharacterized protein LOC108096139 isoform X2 [Drosophila ficusphila]
MSDIIERKTLMQDKRKLLENKRMTMGMKSICASVMGSMFQTNGETRYSFNSMSKRHKADKDYVDSNYKDIAVETYEPIYKTVFDDDRDPVREPSFSHHRIPLAVPQLKTGVCESVQA